MYKLAAADRAFAGFLKPFPFPEYKTALSTFSRGNYKMSIYCINCLPNMFKVFINLFFRDADAA